MPFFSLPNIISLSRIALLPAFIFLLYSNNIITAVAIFILAGLTDKLDGFIAKKKKMESYTGRLVDVLADTIFFVGSFIAVMFYYNIWWVLGLLIFTKQLVIGLFIIFFSPLNKKYRQIYFKKHMMPRLSSFFQVLAILTIMLDFYKSYFIWLAILLSLLAAIQWLYHSYKILKIDSK